MKGTTPVKWFELFKIGMGDKVWHGDKRQYFPYVLRWRCETCGGENETDFSGAYLSYPAFETAYEVSLSCSKCDAKHGEPRHTIKLIPRLVLEIAEGDEE